VLNNVKAIFCAPVSPRDHGVAQCINYVVQNWCKFRDRLNLKSGWGKACCSPLTVFYGKRVRTVSVVMFLL